jgi:hypothetical protein
VICVEAQPILGSTLHWRIVDAKRGVLDEGYAELADLARRKPWDYGEASKDDSKPQMATDGHR